MTGLILYFAVSLLIGILAGFFGKKMNSSDMRLPNPKCVSMPRVGGSPG